MSWSTCLLGFFVISSKASPCEIERNYTRVFMSLFLLFCFGGYYYFRVHQFSPSQNFICKCFLLIPCFSLFILMNTCERLNACFQSLSHPSHEMSSQEAHSYFTPLILFLQKEHFSPHTWRLLFIFLQQAIFKYYYFFNNVLLTSFLLSYSRFVIDQLYFLFISSKNLMRNKLFQTILLFLFPLSSNTSSSFSSRFSINSSSTPSPASNSSNSSRFLIQI